eukprot:gnl/Trimastix_PCT/4168.p1 GENE.gnl/Trimastix_PCT/4168~~gnl/Trimastix_PCT/4168.p1  ORF type:complete len:1094 (-),score=409.15 gnl/Trimastix_PCT/4168:212-3493(-)
MEERPPDFSQLPEGESQAPYGYLPETQEAETLMAGSKPKLPLAGTIREVRLINFMNHTNYKTTFSPRINILHGPNGAGKSAIIVGIAVCLGCKASATTRARSMRDLVRTGASKARVTVVLNNQGRDAFRPQIFGDSIMIQRVFSRNVSNYHICNAEGKLVEKKKEYLEQILNHFGIFVESPAQLMQQEEMKAFLHSVQATRLYELVSRSTYLTTIHEDLRSVKTNHESTLRDLRDREVSLTLERGRVEELQREYQAVRHLEEDRVRLQQLKAKASWDRAGAFEAQVAKIEKQSDKWSKLVLATTEKRDEAQAKLQEAQADMEAHQGSSEEIIARAQQLQEQKRLVHHRQLDEIQEIRHHEAKCKQHRKEASACIERAETTSAQLERLQQTAGREYEEQRAQLQQDIERLEAQQQKLEADAREIQQRANELGHAAQPLRQQRQELRASIGTAQNRDATIARHLSGLRQHRGTSNTLRLFAPEMPAFLDLLRRNQAHFRLLPAGPVGALIKVHEEHRQWVPIVETYLTMQGMLSCFVCSCWEDERLFHRLLKQHFPTLEQKIRVRVQRCRDPSQTYQMNPSQLPRPEYPTIHRIIECANPLVVNMLIDSSSIERIVMSPTREEGEDLIFRGGPNAANVFQVWSLDGYAMQRRGRAEQSRDVQLFNRHIGVSVEQRVAELERERATVVEELRALQNEDSRLDREIRAADAEKRQTADRVRALKRQVHQVQDQADERRRRLDTLEEPDLTLLEADIEESRKRAEALEAKAADAAAQVETHRALKAQHEEEQARIQEERARIDEEVHREGEIVMEMETAIKQAEGHVAHYSTHLASYTGKKRDVDQKLGAARKEYEDALTEAKSLAPEEPTGITHSGRRLLSEIERIEARLRTNAHGKDPQELHDRLQEAEAAFIARESSHNNTVQLAQRLGISLNKQFDRWKRLVVNIYSKLSQYFAEFLEHRRMAGELVADHVKKTLELHVDASGEEPGEGRGAKGLSGGERSFTTMCLLLSLWKQMQWCPFHVVDEFDVYCDELTRRLASTLLFKLARSSDSQYILVTPQSVEGYQNDHDIKILYVDKQDRVRDARPVDPEGEGE